MFTRLLVFVLMIGMPPTVASAADDEPAAPASSEMSQARLALDVEDYAKAENLLRARVSTASKDADAWNLLGYALRKQGKMDEAEVQYQTALSLDKEHKGALEYLGMLYVQTGRIDEAKGLLARLDDVCFFGCDEYDSLKKAITSLNTY